ncbi:hypothetical protein JXO52_07470 [bacterium]|nr:hypothetical protein [bacterium]
MRITSWLLIAALLLSVAAVFAQDTKVDFSGTWIMNADKSDMGGGPGGDRGGRGGRGFGGGGPMVVEMKDNTMTVTTTRTGRDGEEMTTVMTYTLDGKECENESGRGSSVSTAVWSKDGKSITINTETHMSFGDREMTMNSEEVWSMDGAALKIKSVRSTPRGDMESTRVYDKEKAE